MKHMEGVGRFECSLGRGRVNHGEFRIKMDVFPDGGLSGTIFEEKETELKWYHSMPFLGEYLISLFPPRTRFNPESAIKGKIQVDILTFYKEYKGAKVPGYIQYELTRKGDGFEGVFQLYVYDQLEFKWTSFSPGKAHVKFID